jgi:hypothetical protein
MKPLVYLSELLRAAAQDLARQQPPAGRDAAVLAAMRRALPNATAAPAPPAPRRWWRPLAWSGVASCAALLLGVGLLLMLEPPPATEEHAASDFLPLVPSERWSGYLRDSQAQPAWLVATEMPRERLALLGLPYDPAQAGERVRAELLLHPSGDVLAVRILR